jgi:hypothetical protein
MRPTRRGIIHLQPPRQKVLTAQPVDKIVDVSKLKAGLYLIEILTENRITRTKFLKD